MIDGSDYKEPIDIEETEKQLQKAIQKLNIIAEKEVNNMTKGIIYEVALRFLGKEQAEEAQLKIHKTTGYVTEEMREVAP